MAKYESKFKELGFYVDGELKRFSNGKYSTDDKAEITALDGISDAIKQHEEEPKATPKQTEAKPASKSPARKPFAK